MINNSGTYTLPPATASIIAESCATTNFTMHTCDDQISLFSPTDHGLISLKMRDGALHRRMLSTQPLQQPVFTLVHLYISVFFWSF